MNELTITMSEDEFTKSVNKIKGVIGKIENGYLSIASDLAKIKEQEGYLYSNYDNIYDFAKAEFNMARGSVSNILAVEKVICDESHKYIACMKSFKLTVILYLLKQADLKPDEIRQKVADGTLTSDLSLESVKQLFPCNERLENKAVKEETEADAETDAEVETETETETGSEVKKINIEFELDWFDEKGNAYSTELVKAFYDFANKCETEEKIIVTFTAR